ncbi:Uncharacterized protein BM_BM14249, partial [Brugia malayi]
MFKRKNKTTALKIYSFSSVSSVHSNSQQLVLREAIKDNNQITKFDELLGTS